MVGAFGEVQVMDWGLAKVLAEGGNDLTMGSAWAPCIDIGGKYAGIVSAA